MKTEKLPTLVEVPRVGSEYIKLGSGQLVKWQSFDEKTQMFEIHLPGGKMTKVHRRDIQIPTANEEVDFLRLRTTVSN